MAGINVTEGAGTVIRTSTLAGGDKLAQTAWSKPDGTVLDPTAIVGTAADAAVTDPTAAGTLIAVFKGALSLLGVGATGVAQLAGGSGLQGWLSAIYKTLVSLLAQYSTGNVATAQIAVGVAAVQVVAARAGRRSVTIVNHQAVAIYVGAAGVATNSGLLLAAQIGASVTLNTAAALYAIAGAAGQTVSFIEDY